MHACISLELMEMKVELIPLDRLVVSKCNVRQRVDEDSVRRLMLNIMRHGLLNPLTVRPEGDKFGIVCGKLRFEAIKRLREEHPEVYERYFRRGVPCIVRKLSDKEAVILSLSENLRQNTMSKDEIGAALERLQTEFGLSEEEISRELQLMAEEVYNALKVYRALRAVETPTLKPGRPKRGQKRKGLGGVAALRIASLARSLREAGVVESEEEASKKLSKIAEGLSSREAAILVSKLKSRPDLIKNEAELKKVVEELKKGVERVVLLKSDLAQRISEIARIRGLTFDEVLNLALEEGLKVLEEKLLKVPVGN